MQIDTIQQTVTNIKTSIENQKLSKMKKDTLKLLQDYPLTYKEFEEYINFLVQIKENSVLLIQNSNDNIEDENAPLRDKVILL